MSGRSDSKYQPFASFFILPTRTTPAGVSIVSGSEGTFSLSSLFFSEELSVASVAVLLVLFVDEFCELFGFVVQPLARKQTVSSMAIIVFSLDFIDFPSSSLIFYFPSLIKSMLIY